MINRRTILLGLAAGPVAAAIPFTPAVAAPIVPGLLGTLKADIERIIYMHAMFEWNDDLTRHFVRIAVAPYMSALALRGEIWDWRIVCDKTNNTPEIIDMNDFLVDLYLKLPKDMTEHRLHFSILELAPRVYQENLTFEETKNDT